MNIKSANIIRFSIQHPTHLYAKNIVLDQRGFPSFKLYAGSDVYKVTLNVPGLHHVYNTLASIACGIALHLDIKTMVYKISEFKGVPQRLRFLKGPQGVVIIDDTYNANLDSVLVALDVLESQPGRRILVLGDLGELGDCTEAHHEQIGKTAKKKSIDWIFTCGHHAKISAISFGEQGMHFTSQAALIEKIKPLCHDQTTILVKGSRAAQMENIVEALLHIDSTIST